MQKSEAMKEDKWDPTGETRHGQFTKYKINIEVSSKCRISKSLIKISEIAELKTSIIK